MNVFNLFFIRFALNLNIRVGASIFLVISLTLFFILFYFKQLKNYDFCSCIFMQHVSIFHVITLN